MRRSRRAGDAREIFEKALAVQAQTVGCADLEYARTLNNLSLVMANEKDYAGADAMYSKAMEIRRKKAGVNHPDYALSLHNLERLRTCQNRFAEAGSFLN